MKRSKTRFPPKLVKNPRTLAELELFNRHCLTTEETKQALEIFKIERLTNELFNLNGAYPYLIDFLNFVCTHYPDRIERKTEPNETHYRVLVSKKVFKDLALGNYTDQKQYLEQEIYRLLSDKDENGEPIRPKIFPFNSSFSVRTKPIRIEIWYEDENQLIQLKPNQISLQNVTGNRVKGYAFEFYKPLWREIFTSKEGGTRWFPLPTMFQAKLVDSINRYKNDPEFEKYGSFGYPSNYRKLYLYLNLHDNSNSEVITYDAIDFTLKTLPKNIQKKNNTFNLHNWFTSHQFFQKGLRPVSYTHLTLPTIYSV